MIAGQSCIDGVMASFFLTKNGQFLDERIAKSSYIITDKYDRNKQKQTQTNYKKNTTETAPSWVQG